MSFIKKLQKNINKVSEGDFGDIHGYRLTRDGNTSRYIKNIAIEEVRSETATLEEKDGLIITASGGVEGDASIGTAKFNLQFGSEGTFLYHLKDLTNIQFKDRREAFEKLGVLIISKTIKWKDDYMLVTEVKQAG